MKNRLFSGSPFEDYAGYARAVLDGDWIHLSGTVGSDQETGEIPEEAGEQARNIFRIVEKTLGEAGARMTDILRCRVFITDMEHLDAVAKVLGEVLGDIRPANTTLLCGIPAPGAKVEIEVTARKNRWIESE